MLVDEWKQKVLRLGGISATVGSNSYPQARIDLVEFYDVMLHAPADVHHVFNGLEDLVIHEPSLQAEARILRGNFSLKVSSGASLREVAIDVAAYIRALDRYVAQQAPSLGPSSRPMNDWRVRTSSTDYFLVPRYVRPAPKKGNFEKRALLHHKILPTRIGDYLVELNVKEGRFATDVTHLTAGGALFENIEFITSDFDSGFIVSNVTSADHLIQIEQSLNAGVREGCDIVLFPELTITPSCRTFIQEFIRDGILIWDRPVGLVVAGSWHESRENNYVNVATIFDNKGNIIATHEKLFRYWDNSEKKMEAIRPGQQLTVLVRDDALVAFGICRDFCERVHPNPNPYTQLPVDLYLIVSTGNRTTMAGHLRTASDIRDLNGGRSVVLQQAYSNLKDQTELGYMIGSSDPLNPPETNFAHSKTWVRRP